MNVRDTHAIGLVSHTAVLHREAHLVRIQVKTGRLLDNGTSFDFNTVSVAPGKGKHRKKDYEGKAEYFAVYLPDNGKVYMIPVNGVPTSGPLTLRFKAAGLLLGGRYGTKRVPYEEAVRMKYSLWWAEDYEI